MLNPVVTSANLSHPPGARAGAGGAEGEGPLAQRQGSPPGLLRGAGGGHAAGLQARLPAGLHRQGPQAGITLLEDREEVPESENK